MGPIGRVRPEEESGRPWSKDLIEAAARTVDAGSAGLSVGLQVASRPWREDLAKTAMATMEEAFQDEPGPPAVRRALTPRPLSAELISKVMC